ncbi:MAG TPA: hypothetical protein VIS75_13970, partial [Chitinophagaceae bacterium]
MPGASRFNCCSFGADAFLPVGRLSYKLSITTQDFFNILYWFEEKAGTLRTMGNEHPAILKKPGS